MRQLKILIGVTAALVLACVGLAGSADAASAQQKQEGGGGGYVNWTCNFSTKNPNEYSRVCGELATRPGVRARGSAYRTYPTLRQFNPQASFDVSIRDTTPRDGKCAYIRWRVTDSAYYYKPMWRAACKGGTAHWGTGNILRETPYTAASHVKLWICQGQNPKGCKLIWNEAVGKNPYLKN